MLLLVSWGHCSAVAAEGLLYIETADGEQSTDTRQLVQWTHARMVFNKDLTRVAVGLSDTMEVEILGGREVLLLAKEIGRTSLIVWYPDGTTETFLFSVIQDLSVLERALSDIHPNIRIVLAPDRDALILRGKVPTMTQRSAAESIAKQYLSTGASDTFTSQTVLSQNTNSGAAVRIGNAPTDTASTIINLIQVETLPLTTKEKIEQSIRDLGGKDVTVERIMRGDVESDEADTLLLGGEVENQIELVRVLNIAARLFLGRDIGSDGIEDTVTVLADESGGLLEAEGQRGNRGNRGNQQNNGNQIPGMGNGGEPMSNDIRANIGRAKLLSVANGRILSMIKVRDLPQVRVSVQMHEVNRGRLKAWDPNLSVVSDGYTSNAVVPAGGISVQEDPSQRIGAAGSRQIEGALQLLGGTLVNNFQVGFSDVAFDLLFSLMEDEGISRTLSRPTLTVLAGESALFQVGGEVPVPSSFAPAGTDSGSSGVFSGTDFRAFGVQLEIRPMVGDDDRITLDVRPTVSMPDTLLTQQIAGSSGSDLNSSVFSTRSLQTTARLRDGQPLVIGGLMSRGISDSKRYTPGVHNVPGVGWLAKSSQTSDSDRELIIVVTPTIVREPLQAIAMWQFPNPHDLLRQSVGIPASQPGGERQ